MNSTLELLARSCDELVPALLCTETDAPRRATFLVELDPGNPTSVAAPRVRVDPLPGPCVACDHATVDFRDGDRDFFVTASHVEPTGSGAWLTLAGPVQERPRRARRIAAGAEAAVASFVPEGLGLGRCHLMVLDIGAGGLRVESSIAFPAGTVLRDLVVVHRDDVLRRAEGVVVGCTAVLPAPGRAAWWCSVRLRAPLAAPRQDDPADDVDVDEPERVRALLWALSDLGRPVKLRWGTRMIAGQLLPVKDSRAALPPMRCRLDEEPGAPAAAVTVETTLWGSGLRFTARVLEMRDGVARLRPEAVVRTWKRRQEERVAIDRAAGARVAFRHPLSGAEETRRIADLSSHGMSIVDDEGDEVLWPGLRLADVRVELPGLPPYAVDAQVRSVAAERTGLEVAALPAAVADRVRVQMLRMAGGPVELDDGEDLDEIIGFHRRAGLLEPEMSKNLDATIDAARDGWRRAHQHPEGLMRTALGRTRGALDATHNIVRGYDDGWIFQHSASGSSSTPAHQGALQSALIELAIARPDGEYFCGFVNDEAKSHHAGLAAHFATSTPELRGSTRFVLYAAPANPEPADFGDVKLVRLVKEGEALVERAARRLLDPVCVAALGLRAGRIGLARSRAAFARVGLERGREAWGAVRDGRVVAILVREWASPGLSLSSLLCSGMLLPVRPEDDADGAGRRALLTLLRGAPVPGDLPQRFVFVPAGADEAPMIAAGFERAGSCVLYAWHRTGMREYYRYVNERYGLVYGRLQARAALARGEAA